MRGTVEEGGGQKRGEARGTARVAGPRLRTVTAKTVATARAARGLAKGAPRAAEAALGGLLRTDTETREASQCQQGLGRRRAARVAGGMAAVKATRTEPRRTDAAPAGCEQTGQQVTLADAPAAEAHG